MKTKVGLYLALSGLLLSLSVINKPVSQDVKMTTFDNDNGVNEVRRAVIGNSNEELDYSKLYIQHGIKDNKKAIRYAIALKGDIESINFTLNVEKLSQEETDIYKSQDVSIVYGGLKSQDEIVYYNPASENGLTTDTFYAGNYYWACCTVTYSNEERLESLASITVKVNDEVISGYSNTYTNIVNNSLFNSYQTYTFDKVSSSLKNLTLGTKHYLNSSENDYVEIATDESNSRLEISNLRTTKINEVEYNTSIRHLDTTGQKIRFHINSDYTGYVNLNLVGTSNICSIVDGKISEVKELKINDFYKLSNVYNEEISIPNNAIFPSLNDTSTTSINIFNNAAKEVNIGTTFVTKGENIFYLETISSNKYGYNFTGANIMGLTMQSIEPTTNSNVNVEYRLPKGKNIKIFDTDEATTNKYVIDKTVKTINFKDSNLTNENGFFEIIDTNYSTNVLMEIWNLDNNYCLRNMDFKGQKIRFHIFSKEQGKATLSMLASNNMFTYEDGKYIASYDFNFKDAYKLSRVETNVNGEEKLINIDINQNAIIKGIESEQDSTGNYINKRSQIWSVGSYDLGETYLSKGENVFEIEVISDSKTNYSPFLQRSVGANIAGLLAVTK